jgi:hypothetical protein
VSIFIVEEKTATGFDIGYSMRSIAPLVVDVDGGFDTGLGG